MKRLVTVYALALLIGIGIAAFAILLQAAGIIGIAYLIGFKVTFLQALGVSLAISLAMHVLRARAA